MPKAPKLDNRLLAAAQLVKRGLPAADIGCDHAKLAAWLVCSGHCPRVIACDLREGPLKKAAETCKEYQCTEQVELRLGSGLEPLRPNEAKTIVLAGISAQTTIEILEAAPWVKTIGMRLVCVPATKTGVLRRWLWLNGFAVCEDAPVCAAGRWYTAIAAEYTGETHVPSDLECVLGLCRKDEVSRDYLIQLTEKIRKNRLGAAENSELAHRLDALLAELNI